MARSNTRARRNVKGAETNDTNPIDEIKNSSKSDIATRILIVPVSPVESNASESTTEGESANPSTTEVSSNTSDSGYSSDKSSVAKSSDSSVTSGELLQKSKEDLIKNAQDLDMQLQDLIKIYYHEKKLYVDKSIHLLETDSHPDWNSKLTELQNKREDALRIATERHRLRIDSVMAEYDYTVKNVSDELEAAENEIIDEFTTKRKKISKIKEKENVNIPQESTETSASPTENAD